MGAMIWIVQSKELPDQCIHFLGGQFVIAFHRCLAGHGSHFFIDKFRCHGGGQSIGKAVKNLYKQILLRYAEQIIRNRAYGELLTPKRFNFKSDPCETVHMLRQYFCFLHG